MNNTPHTNCLTLRLLHAAKGYKAVAFDIFDTLLKRDCAHPADLFALMEVTHQAALGFAEAPDPWPRGDAGRNLCTSCLAGY